MEALSLLKTVRSGFRAFQFVLCVVCARVCVCVSLVFSFFLYIYIFLIFFYFLFIFAYPPEGAPALGVCDLTGFLALFE
jgi:hypothetical protein